MDLIKQHFNKVFSLPSAVAIILLFFALGFFSVPQAEAGMKINIAPKSFTTFSSCLVDNQSCNGIANSNA